MFRKYPPVEHILFIGKPGSYKDVSAVRYCFKGFKNDKKLVFSNLHLFFSCKYIEDLVGFKDIRGDNWNPSMVYIHDIGALFHSREFWKREGNSVDARKLFVNSYRKRGLQIIGTLHREGEIDIEIRRIVDYFVYPVIKNVGDPNNMEDDIVVLYWYNTPIENDDGSRPLKEKPDFKTFYMNPERYAVLYNTLE